MVADHAWDLGWPSFESWVTILGKVGAKFWMVGDNSGDGGWPSFGSWVTIIWMMGDHPWYGRWASWEYWLICTVLSDLTGVWQYCYWATKNLSSVLNFLISRDWTYLAARYSIWNLQPTIPITKKVCMVFHVKQVDAYLIYCNSAILTSLRTIFQNQKKQAAAKARLDCGWIMWNLQCQGKPGPSSCSKWSLLPSSVPVSSQN